MVVTVLSGSPKVFALLLFTTVNVVFAEDPLELQQGDQPDHLEPVPLRSGEYSRMIEERLLVTTGDYGRMILLPSFEGETAISIYGSDFTEEYPKQPRTFHITVTKADKSLYLTLPRGHHKDPGPRPKIIRLDVKIDRDFAVAIQRAWATMLLNTRYPLKSYAGLDGFTAQFSVFVRGAGVLHGQIWSPNHGLPKEFVEIGRQLIDYCSTSEKERPAKRARVMERLEEFTREAAKASTG
ncbi:MAG: hypothetical protein DME22_13885 [Verrucomicrobia bacterium]|nr:MAG: hypothetical protein DME22_13885 [Verrucomicrobiota bacterium]